jgi:type I restriction enzyme, S subunit
MKFPAYTKYKPSGVEWLGDVPEHWEVKRLSYLATLKSGENITSEMIAEGGEYAVFGGNGLRGYYHKFTHRGHHALIGRQGALCGNINYASGQFYASEHALVVSPLKEFAVVWIGELLRAMNLGQYSVTAAQPGIAAEVIRGLLIPVPPLSEQRAIAVFLNRLTERVDGLVAKKRELIERLKEKRTALISRTVTRGLPPAAARATGLPENPPLKNSGLDWLGGIPKHWEAKRLKYIFPPLVSGVSVNSDNTPTLDESPGIMKTSCVYGNTFNPNENKRVLEAEFDRVACPVTRNSLIISRMNTPELVGSCGYVGIDYLHLFLPDRLWIARFDNRKDTHGKFAWYLVISHAITALTGVLATGTSDSMKNLTQEAFLNIPIGVPPLFEQVAIAEYLDEETSKLDALVGKVEAAVERLQEYRTALITATVTGKINCAKTSTV